MKIINFKSKKIVNEYSKNPLAAVYIFYPALLKLVGNIQGKNVLDIGCGSGWFSHELSKRGAKVFALDNSPRWINICKGQNKESGRLKFFLASCDDLSIVKASKFDIVFANMLFLSIASRQIIEKAFSEIGRVINKGGIFIFNDIHPLAIVSPKTSTKIGGMPVGFSNFKEGFKCKTRYLLADYSSLEYVDAHWSLGLFSKLLKKNGFVIEEISEPKPFKMDPKKRLMNYRIPEYIIFKCKKI